MTLSETRFVFYCSSVRLSHSPLKKNTEFKPKYCNIVLSYCRRTKKMGICGSCEQDIAFAPPEPIGAKSPPLPPQPIVLSIEQEFDALRIKLRARITKEPWLDKATGWTQLLWLSKIEIVDLTFLEWKVIWTSVEPLLFTHHQSLEFKREIVELLHACHFPWSFLVLNYREFNSGSYASEWIDQLLIHGNLKPPLSFDNTWWLTHVVLNGRQYGNAGHPWRDHLLALLSACSHQTLRNGISINGKQEPLAWLMWTHANADQLKVFFKFCKDTRGEAIDLLEVSPRQGTVIDFWCTSKNFVLVFDEYLDWIGTIRIIQRSRAEYRIRLTSHLAPFQQFPNLLQNIIEYESWIPTYDDPTILRANIAKHSSIIQRAGNLLGDKVSDLRIGIDYTAKTSISHVQTL